MSRSGHPTNTQFGVSVWHQDRQTVSVVLSGELDLSSAPQLRDCLAELANAGVINLVIDLANLMFLDSTGISLLVTDFKRATASGGSFAVRNASPEVMRVFDITGLVELLSVTAIEPSADTSDIDRDT
jgi:anti-sigma B factor antagonist